MFLLHMYLPCFDLCFPLCLISTCIFKSKFVVLGKSKEIYAFDRLWNNKYADDILNLNVNLSVKKFLCGKITHV